MFIFTKVIYGLVDESLQPTKLMWLLIGMILNFMTPIPHRHLATSGSQKTWSIPRLARRSSRT